MLAYRTRAAVVALLLTIAGFALPAAHTHAAPAALYDGMAVQLSGFTPQQEQVIENGLALFDDMASPMLVRPSVLRMSAVPGAVSTTYASWTTVTGINASVIVGGQPVGVIAHVNSQPQLSDVWITFGVDRLGVGQVVHELTHVVQIENPAWGDAERAYAASHPYPQSGMGLWIATPAPEPESEYCPRVIESTFEVGAGMAAYAETQPGDVRWCLAHLAGG